MAGFLAWHGEDGLWQMLQRTQIGGRQACPRSKSCSTISTNSSEAKGTCSCFDDFEHVDEDPLVGQLAERLRQAGTWTGEFRLILTSQRLPDFVQTTCRSQPLSGMTA